MKVIEGLDRVEPQPGGTVLTIGNFDGVHRAHQTLIRKARDLTSRHCQKITVLTFEPHPLSIIAPGREPPRLCTLRSKIDLLERAGADVVVVARSDPTLLGMEPEDFVLEVVQAKFAPRHIVEGASFGFGKGRRGTTELLGRIAAGFGCVVHLVEQVTVSTGDGESLVVSSSLIRDLLSRGDVVRAALCLGRPYELAGKVVPGDGRGRTIGFATANLEPDEQLVPGEGVYAGVAHVGKERYRTGISVGRTPTFDGGQVRIEAHLLDYEGDLYGQRMSLTFAHYIRPQRKFPSVDSLVDQIKEDMQIVCERVSDAESSTAPTGIS